MRIIFKNFTSITTEEKHLVLGWRNSDRVRLCMLNQSVIPLADHMRWLSSLPGDERNIYFLVYDDEEPIGVLDFTSIDRAKREAFWGFYLTRGSRPGFGVIGSLALNWYFESLDFAVLHSRVIPSNAGSCNWHEKLFFIRENGADTGGDAAKFILGKAVWLAGRAKIESEMFARYKPENVVWKL